MLLPERAREIVYNDAVKKFTALAKMAESQLINVSPVTIKLTQTKLRKSASRHYDYLFIGTYEITSQLNDQQFTIKISAHADLADEDNLWKWQNAWCYAHAKEYLGDAARNLNSDGDRWSFIVALDAEYNSANGFLWNARLKIPFSADVSTKCKKLYAASVDATIANNQIKAMFKDIYNEPSTMIKWAEPNGRDQNSVGYIVCKSLRKAASAKLL